MFTLFLFLISLLAPTATLAACPISKHSRIGIVGGGVSGLFLANHLTNDGFSDITIFEREHEVVHICNTTWIDGHPHDASIVFIGAQLVPALNWQPLWNLFDWFRPLMSPAMGLLPSFPKLFETLPPLGSANVGTEGYDSHLKKLGIHARPVSPLPTQEWAKSVPFMQAIKNDSSAVVLQLVKMWTLIEQWVDQGYSGVPDCLNHGIALPTETYGEWVVRQEMNETGVYLAYMFDFFGNPTALSAPACQVLAGCVLKWQAAIPFFVLAALKVDSSSVSTVPPRMMAQALVALQNNLVLYRIEEGYCEVFRRTQQLTRAQFLFDTEVLSVSTSNNCDPITLTTANGVRHQFDRVILAMRPQDLSAIGFHEFEDFSRVSYQVQIVRTSSALDVSHRIANNSNDVLIPIEPTLGTTYVSRSGHLQGVDSQFPDSSPDVMVLIGNGNSPDTFGDKFSSDLKKLFHIDISHVFFNKTFNEGPNFLKQSNIAAFYNHIQQRQGNNGLYFIGEYLAGHGVPENFEYSRRFATQYFTSQARGLGKSSRKQRKRH